MPQVSQTKQETLYNRYLIDFANVIQGKTSRGAKLNAKDATSPSPQVSDLIGGRVQVLFDVIDNLGNESSLGGQHNALGSTLRLQPFR
jgi:hypothetical protein